MLRIYTSIKKHRLEAENRLAMAKMLAHIENTDNKLIDKEYYQKQFLPELAKVIITPLYPDKNQRTDATNLAEMIKQPRQKINFKFFFNGVLQNTKVKGRCNFVGAGLVLPI